ncbi:hypothetical protein FACS1894103_0200 [Campylobacterota bacterium]|nr:hypothetical protein FACS1894103_0200 [Campylobacterota bacterium]
MLSNEQLEQMLGAICLELREIKEAVIASPDWISINSIALKAGLTARAVRYQLRENFTEGRDYKKLGGRIFIAKTVAAQIQRRRADGKNR